MRKVWFLIPLLLVGIVWLFGCDEQLPSAPVEAATESPQPLQAAVNQGLGGKPAWLPTDCTAGQTITWDATEGTFVCTDLTLSGYEKVTAMYMVPAGYEPSLPSWEVKCSPGRRVLGGGYHNPEGYDYFEIWTNAPNQAGDGWHLEVWNKGQYETPLGVYAICADVAE
jgi:hypothetical protein